VMVFGVGPMSTEELMADRGGSAVGLLGRLVCFQCAVFVYLASAVRYEVQALAGCFGGGGPTPPPIVSGRVCHNNNGREFLRVIHAL
jgi:hypothetical protein